MTIQEILEREGQSVDDVLKEHITLSGLARISHFEAQNSLFEKKYKKTFEQFNSELERQTGTEDFAKEDDLLDWEFAKESLDWWINQMKVVDRAG